MHKLLLLLALPILLTGCFLSHSEDSSHLRQAEELSRQGEHDRAIAEYRLHMQSRLDAPKRPEWENPYFYLLLIGDIELGRGQVDAAKRSYEDAAKNGIDAALISDRYRSLAYWYESHGRLAEAIAILEPQRALDPILIESTLDRLAKALTVAEQKAGGRPAGGAPVPRMK